MNLDSKRLGELIDKNYPGFEFSALKDDSKYWKILNSVCNNGSKYSKQQPEQSETFKALKILLEQKEIHTLLCKNEILVHKMMTTFISKDMQACFDLFIDLNKQQQFGWNLKFTPNYDDLSKKFDYSAQPAFALLTKISSGNYKLCKHVIDTGLYDINYSGSTGQTTALLTCAAASGGYTKGIGVKQCNNYKLFTYLLDQPDIDVTATGQFGRDVIALLVLNEKPEYIEYIRERIQNKQTDNWSGELTEEMIDRTIEKFEKVQEIIGAVEKSDIKKLTAILNDKTTQVMMKDIINIRGRSHQQSAFRTPLQTCIHSLFCYDFKNPTKCDNYKCFIKLLEQKGINPHERGRNLNESAPFACLQCKKPEYFKVLVEMFNNKLNVKDNDGKRIVIDKNPISTDDYDNILRWGSWNSDDSERFKMLFKLVYDNKRFDINDLFILCCKSSIGYDSNRAKTCENFKIFEFLLQQPGINLNCQWTEGYWRNKTTALMELVKGRKYEYLKYFYELQNNGTIKLKFDYDKQLTNDTEADLLFLAVNESDYRSVKVLLNASNHWDINKPQTLTHKTAALLSAHINVGYNEGYPFVGSNFCTFKTLLEQKGIDLNIASSWGTTPIHFMMQAENNKDRWIDYLLDEWDEGRLTHVVADISKEKKLHYRNMYAKTDELTRICKFSDYDALMRILDDPENKEDICEYVNYWSKEYDNRPLDALARHTQWGYDSENQLECRQFECFKALLNVSGIKVVSYTMEQLVTNDKYEYIRYLIENNDKLGLKINFQDIVKRTRGRDPLVYVQVGKSSHKTLQLMLEMNVFDINNVDWESGTLLHQCATITNASYYNSQFPFECDLFEFIKILLNNKNIDINKRDKEGSHMLAAMIRHNKFDYFKYIIDENESGKYNWKLQDLNTIVNDWNRNLLHIAVQMGNVECLSYLLNKNIFDDLNHIGGISKDTVLNACIRSKANYNSSYYRECDNFKCFKMLLLDSTKGKNGERVHPYIKNKMGYNAFECCTRVGKLEYLQELQAVFQEK